MNAGEIVAPRIALYVGIWNLYRNDLNLARETAQIAETLTYNQIEFDYIWDQDILNMQDFNESIQSKSGLPYCYIIVPSHAMVPAEVNRQFSLLEKKCIVLYLQKMNMENLVDACRKKTQKLVNVLSSNTAISMRSRQLGQGIQCSLLLNESTSIQELTLNTTLAAKVFDIDLNTWA
jgi:hypothetical protein